MSLNLCLNQGIKGLNVNTCNLTIFQRNKPMFIRMLDNRGLKLNLWMNFVSNLLTQTHLKHH